MKSLPLLILFFAIPILSVFAKPIEITTANVIAKNVYYENFGVKQSEIIFENHFTKSVNGKNLYYIFNIKGSKGYIIISADDRVYPVLGFSDTGKIELKNQPVQFSGWMNKCSKQIEFAITNKVKSDQLINSKWSHYNNSFDNFNAIKGTNNITPLLSTIVWDQGAGWNNECPVDASGPGGHVYVGCVATALAQVMYYWQYPAQGTGSHSYDHSTYGTISADFGATTYDWSSMSPTDYSGDCPLLQFHVGVAVDMDYAADGSGTQLTKGAYALPDYFGYSNTAANKDKMFYSTEAWQNLIIEELQAGRPLPYRGDDGSAGHAFVLDGVSGNDYFHFNWGWSGYSNGYFYLNDLTPGSNTFTQGQGCITGLEPESGNTMYETPLNLAANVVGSNVELTWLSPSAIPDGFNDDFEFYDDFIIENIGDWTMFDLDGGATWTIQDIDFTNKGYTGSFIIFNQSQCTPNPSGWEAHSGSKMAACFDAVTASAPNDDWLISPQVTITNGDQLSFWVKSINDQYGLERYSIHVSTTTAEVAEMVKISSGTYLEAATDWTKATYDLSSYAGQDVYIGIHVVSNDAFCFLLDDFFVGNSSKKKLSMGFEENETTAPVKSFSKVETTSSVVANLSTKESNSFSGYEVFRDGTSISDLLPQSTLTYTDENVSVGSHTYCVKAVYNSGVYSDCTDDNEKTVTLVNVSDLQQSDIKIYPNPTSNNLTISFIKSSEYYITLTNITGKEVFKKTGSGNNVLFDVSSLSKGIYFINIKTTNKTITEKIIIK